MDVARTPPNAALFLELGVWLVQYIVEQRQLLYLKRILDRDNRDPVWLAYREVLNMNSNLTGQITFLVYGKKYILPLNDLNIQNLSEP